MTISPTVDIRTAVCISGVCSDLGCFVRALLWPNCSNTTMVQPGIICLGDRVLQIPFSCAAPPNSWLSRILSNQRFIPMLVCGDLKSGVDLVVMHQVSAMKTRDWDWSTRFCALETKDSMAYLHKSNILLSGSRMSRVDCQ